VTCPFDRNPETLAAAASHEAVSPQHPSPRLRATCTQRLVHLVSSLSSSSIVACAQSFSVPSLSVFAAVSAILARRCLRPQRRPQRSRHLSFHRQAVRISSSRRAIRPGAPSSFPSSRRALSTPALHLASLQDGTRATPVSTSAQLSVQAVGRHMRWAALSPMLKILLLRVSRPFPRPTAARGISLPPPFCCPSVLRTWLLEVREWLTSIQ